MAVTSSVQPLNRHASEYVEHTVVANTWQYEFSYANDFLPVCSWPACRPRIIEGVYRLQVDRNLKRAIADTGSWRVPESYVFSDLRVRAGNCTVFADIKIGVDSGENQILEGNQEESR